METMLINADKIPLLSPFAQLDQNNTSVLPSPVVMKGSTPTEIIRQVQASMRPSTRPVWKATVNEKKESADESALSPTTSSLSNLLNGIVCVSPFESAIVDERDSLYMFLNTVEAEWNNRELDNEEKIEREKEAARVVYWALRGAQYQLNRGDGLQALMDLSPGVLFTSAHNEVVLSRYPGFESSGKTVEVKGDGQTKGYVIEDNESNRWKAPELLRRELSCPTLSSIVFSAGMILHHMLSFKQPYCEYDALTAGLKSSKGERSNFYGIQWSSFAELAWLCTSFSPSQRPHIEEVKRRLMKATRAQQQKDKEKEKTATVDDKEKNEKNDEGKNEKEETKEEAESVE